MTDVSDGPEPGRTYTLTVTFRGAPDGKSLEEIGIIDTEGVPRNVIVGVMEYLAAAIKSGTVEVLEIKPS